jgi:hypothetical protein
MQQLIPDGCNSTGRFGQGSGMIIFFKMFRLFQRSPCRRGIHRSVLLSELSCPKKTAAEKIFMKSHVISLSDYAKSRRVSNNKHLILKQMKLLQTVTAPKLKLFLREAVKKP